MFTYFPPVCPANTANNQAGQDQTFLSLPGCVHTGQTACCGNNSAQAQTFVSLPGCVAPTTFVSLPGCVPTFVSLPGCVHTGQAANSTNDASQAQTYFPSIGHCAAAQAPAQAQFPTLSLQCAQVT
ncbi:hypothetical protein, partial [Pectobacterium brasiliense]|uniref:hypothetical protein n=3 Tax=Pectobacterium brasiliense TaxID=180957 RepID=UPI0019690033